VSARFSDGTQHSVTADASWSSSQPQIASVAAGQVTGRSLGRTQIRAQYQNRGVAFSIVVKPEGTFILSGNLTEPGAVTVSGATVAVIGSNPPYQVATVNGSYELFGLAGTVTLAASKPGYLDATQTVTVTRDQKFDFQIKPISPPAPVGGDYRMVLTISPSCSSVPDDQKTRTYTATIQQDNAKLTIRLSDATFVQGKNTFSGQGHGNTTTFDFGSYYYYPYYGYYGVYVREVTSDGQVLGIWGQVTGSVSGQTIAGTLVGGFTYKQNNRTASCSASDNKVVLTKK
jgi:hypothetical protein